MQRRQSFLLFILIFAAIVSSGCGSPGTAPTVSAATAVALQPTAALPTDTPIPPTATPVPPTDTPVPPTPTETPTATPTETLTQTPTVAPSPTRRPPTATRKPTAVSYSCPSGAGGLVVRNATNANASIGIIAFGTGNVSHQPLPKSGETLACLEPGDTIGLLMWSVDFEGTDKTIQGETALESSQIKLLKITGVPPNCNNKCFEETVMKGGGGRPTEVPPYPLPPGKGGLVVRNYYGQEMSFTVNNQKNTIPSSGEKFIVLDPGTYPWSAFIPGQGQAHGSATIVVGQISIQSFAAR